MSIHSTKRMLLEVSWKHKWELMKPMIIPFIVSLYQVCIFLYYYIPDHFRYCSSLGIAHLVTFLVLFGISTLCFVKVVLTDPGKVPAFLTHKMRNSQFLLLHHCKEKAKEFSDFYLEDKKSLKESLYQEFSPARSPTRNNSLIISQDNSEYRSIKIKQALDSSFDPNRPRKSHIMCPEINSPNAKKFSTNAEKYSFCTKCNKPKPPRTHHCSKCDRCVLRMDHHCPWLGNCIGFNNHKYFVLVLFYSFLTLIYTLTCLGIQLIRSKNIFLHHYLYIIFIGISTPEMLFSLVLLIKHLNMISKNVSTLETYRNKDTRPFDLRDWRKNSEQLFGKLSFLWLLPTEPKGRSTDGLFFPLNEEEQIEDFFNTVHI